MDRVITKRYRTDAGTVIWQPHKCTHSGICFRGLPDVFDPRRRPWVDVTAADTASIVAQVARCPSGALAWEGGGAQVGSGGTSASRTVVEPLRDGPLVVHGTITVRAADGTETTSERRTAFCRCGQSSNKPFCDGSHVSAEFRG